jgi:hypothetical protein
MLKYITDFKWRIGKKNVEDSNTTLQKLQARYLGRGNENDNENRLLVYQLTSMLFIPWTASK